MNVAGCRKNHRTAPLKSKKTRIEIQHQNSLRGLTKQLKSKKTRIEIFPAPHHRRVITRVEIQENKDWNYTLVVYQLFHPSVEIQENKDWNIARMLCRGVVRACWNPLYISATPSTSLRLKSKKTRIEMVHPLLLGREQVLVEIQENKDWNHSCWGSAAHYKSGWNPRKQGLK